MDERNTGRRAPLWLGRLVVVGAFMCAAWSFLPHQTIWIDESVQLSGLTLSPASATRWLANAEPHDFGLFRDRMPPLSYWLGWAWSRTFGPGETSLRLMGMLAVSVASLLVFEAAWTAFGETAGWGAGLLFALSPPVVVLSVEIRAYPFLMLWSASALAALTKMLEPSITIARRRACWVVMALSLGAAILTHFFGIVMAGATLSAWFLVAVRRGDRVGPILGLAFVACLATAIDIPFLSATQGISHQDPTGVNGFEQRLIAVQRLADKLLNHPSLSVYKLAGLTVSPGALALLTLASGRSRRTSPARRVIGLTLVLGFAAVATAKLTSHGFDATAPHYNTWMRPPLCVLLSAGLAASSRRARLATGIVLVAVVLAGLSGVSQLATRGEYFAHGPHRPIALAIRELGPRDVGVIHDDTTKHFHFIYGPLRYEFGPGLAQYQSDAAGAETPSVSTHPARRRAGPAATLNHHYLAVIRSQPTGAWVGDVGLPGGPSMPRGKVATSLASSPYWRLLGSRTVPAMNSARVDLFERVEGAAQRNKNTHLLEEVP